MSRSKSLQEEIIYKEIRDLGNVIERKDLESILSSNNIKKTKRTKLVNSSDELSSFLNANIQIYNLQFPRKIYKLFFIDKDKVDPLEVAAKLNIKGYLSHYSAASHHKLTSKVIKETYLNVEQTEKTKKDPFLDQKNIENAFKKTARKSKNYIDFNSQRIHILNGQYTNDLGVINIKGKYRVTDIERTLIDIVVRPHYTGDLEEVLNIYRAARQLISIEKIVYYLKKIDFIYPYHQSIGFLLEAIGYKEGDLELLNIFPLEYDFYLTYNMNNEQYQYSNKWRVYYPRRLLLK